MIILIISIYIIGLILIPKLALSVNDKMIEVDIAWDCDDGASLWSIGIFWPMSIVIIGAILLTYWWRK
jgi:hypothetical protein